MTGAWLLSLAVAGAQTAVAPPKTNDVRAEAMELLRRTIAEQQKHPNQIIREPAAGTAAALPDPDGTRAALERQYLEGKLSAKKYQKALDRWAEDEKKRIAEAEKRRVLEALQKEQAAREARAAAAAQAAKTAAAAAAATAAAKPEPKDAARSVSPPAASAPPLGIARLPDPGAAATPVDPAQQKKISEVEARLDEMLRLKAQREKAALTNASGSAKPGPATPQTKRDQLDALLKQFVDGAITEPEYKEKRAKLLASP